MNILICTQKIDINDDVLGFMHGWAGEFAKKYEKVVVIALGIGEYNLPENVKVLSLGKETGRSRFKYVLRFYKYIWQNRKNYDVVFAHMNREYMILGGWIWKLWRKRTIFWYNHKKGNLFSLWAGFFADNICYTSPHSFFAKRRWTKAKKMPAGIDTDKFRKIPEVQKIKNSILCIGRISQIKNIDVLIEVAGTLDKEGYDFIVDIYGEGIESEPDYLPKLKKQASDLTKKGKVRFLGKVANTEAPRIFNKYELYVNLTNSGSYDKTIPEAMSCEVPVIVSNESFRGVLSNNFIFRERDVKDLKDKILLFWQSREKNKMTVGLRDYVVKNESLKEITNRIEH